MHPWVYGSRVGAWLGPLSVLQYAIADGCRGQSPGNRGSCEHDHMLAWYIRQKNLHRRRKGHAHPHPSFSRHTGRITTNQASIRIETWLCCWRPKDSLLACLRVNISRRRWSFYLARKRVCQNDQKLGFADWENIDRELKRRRRSHPIFSWCTRWIKKNEASARWKFLAFVRV